MPLLDLKALKAAPLAREPFMYTVVERALSGADAAGVLDDFPAIVDPGLLPVEATQPGARFRAFIDELRSDRVARAFSEKFDVDLVGRPMMITARGRCAKRDGRIHTDSETKLVTVLIYFNERWEALGGRLRLLRSPTDLNDVIAEVPPDLGTLVAFRRAENSYHGHEPFEGVRRYVMVNWMTSGFAARKELLRHQASAQVKRALSALRGASTKAPADA